MSKKCAVLVPPCILASGLQVKTAADDTEWRVQYLQLFLRYQADIIPYECSESSFGGFENGLIRSRHGIDFYQGLAGYREHCVQLADTLAEKIRSMENGGYHFAVIVGIEHSPSCAVNYIYTHHGMQKKPGLFIAALKEKLPDREIPFVGINRRYPRKSLNELSRMLADNITQ